MIQMVRTKWKGSETFWKRLALNSHQVLFICLWIYLKIMNVNPTKNVQCRHKIATFLQICNGQRILPDISIRLLHWEFWLMEPKIWAHQYATFYPQWANSIHLANVNKQSNIKYQSPCDIAITTLQKKYLVSFYLYQLLELMLHSWSSPFFVDIHPRSF